MSRAQSNLPITPSLLDRLLDDDPQVAREPPRNRSQSVAEIKKSVRRDLENLLNTRCRASGWPADLTELDHSMISYGLPDYSGSHMRAAEDPVKFLGVVESIIKRFEPRLSNIRVEMMANSQPGDRTLRFRIEAMLPLEGSTDRVSYLSSLETSTGAFHVEGSGA